MGNSTGTSTDTNTGTGIGLQPNNDPFKDVKEPTKPGKTVDDDPGLKPSAKPEKPNGK
ncbi:MULTISPECIES: hypothetical protein [unclassified Shinella]|uniref:hypothetical protein n=1 Tax=unclassified Shinella TaxID=2643062 RepID=UPI00225DC1CA|nr:hypothetical protein [Shinella sp. YE25]MDC7256441.1 hypothetical protein [Shinella sp. YE25]CAI0339308.1 hypothetical protein SHINE37_43162 [Rhizobiaceae bacterium]CAK7257717.1 protein of unknown function [Shinella sp. WSC3-e]